MPRNLNDLVAYTGSNFIRMRNFQTRKAESLQSNDPVRVKVVHSTSSNFGTIYFNSADHRRLSLY